MVKLEDYSPLANDPQPHDNLHSPCKCGAYHKPSDYGLPNPTRSN